MQYNFVALFLSFVLHKSWFYFPYNKGISGVYTMEFSVRAWFRQPMSHSPNHHKLPTIKLSVRC